ncbi:hypothetical protein H7J06_10750 [Mycobacterium hodleri]|uniref:hypothetical protein n=1 Tax=Mycolicibacterium hodleri TaxID=49897 RepID=UPI0021F3745A|nr:hypothetical protein [Mycolicibacterium hodleri]MCV7133461.1 hypothetical protein [Mycolicibacterium hodleri]
MTDALRIIGTRNPVYAVPRDGGGLVLGQGGSHVLLSRDELAELADVIRERLGEPHIQRFTTQRHQ